MYSCWVVGDGALTARCCDILRESGRTLLGVVTDSPMVADWAKDRGVRAVDRKEMAAGALDGEPFDYLFSIVNMRILAPEILAAPRKGAINFHDGPLPEYAGVHCTSWAILAGAEMYGVSWHRMSGGIDEGPVLERELFSVSERETAYSLNAKCYDAAARSFERLDEGLAAGTVVANEQDLSKRSYFGMFQHPEGGAVLDWSQPAAKLDALVRATEFGGQPNLLGTAKLRVGDGYLACKASEAAAGQGQPGEVLEADEKGAVVATGEGALRLKSLVTLDGGAPEPLQPGARLPLPDRKTGERFGRLMEQCSRRESFWVKRFRDFSPRALPGTSDLAAADAGLAPVCVDWSAPAPWRAYVKQSGGDEAVWLRLGVSAFLARLIGEASFDVAWRHPSWSGELTGLEPLFLDAVPFRVRVDFDLDLAAQYETWERAEEKRAQKGACLRDLPLRYPELETMIGRNWVGDCPIVLDIAGDGEPGEARGLFTCQLRTDGAGGAWVFDPARFSEDVAREMAERLTVFLSAVAANPERKLSEAPILSREQYELQLETWNRTAKPLPAGETIVSAFERQARATPDATAVVFGERSLTYRELAGRADRLAAQLCKLGVGPDVIAGLCVERGAEMVVGMLGILKAGGAYLPLDPNYPADRIAYMLEDAEAPVLVTEPSLESRFEGGRSSVVLVNDTGVTDTGQAERASGPAAEASNLAYVIYTSGSTGKPKGVMVEHRNAINFFIAMDEYVQKGEDATWLAVTSLSFDISVLEILYALTRGFKVVVHAGDVLPSAAYAQSLTASKPLDFSLFYFSADQGEDPQNKYRLLTEGAKFADEHGFAAVWTPERHFHNFGGLYPNPSVTSAALAMITKNVQLRSGSVVAPLHSPVRIAEEWSVVDNLSNGRAAVSFASGWMPEDFVIRKDTFADRKKLMMESLDQVRRLWRGEAVSLPGPLGEEVSVKTLPRPIQKDLPVWITTAGNPETFAMAGRAGACVLTHLLGQSLAEVAAKIAAYRKAWTEAGHEGRGWVSLMLHTFVAESEEVARRETEQPLKSYLRTSADLLKKYSWTFPAFKKEVKDVSFGDLPQDELEAVLDHAFDRYFESSGLFGTPEGCRKMVDGLKAHDVDEVACLIDFGIPVDAVLDNLPHLEELRAATSRPRAAVADDRSVAALIRRHKVTHFQCTPSMVSMLMKDESSREALRGLRQWFIGGEPFPGHLASELCEIVPGGIVNMYGPTETTVWSTAHRVTAADVKTPVGRPIANNTIYILDQLMQPVPVGAPGELLIGGAGVVRGYLKRPELTAERFVENPFNGAGGDRIYRTGDLARYRPDGTIELLGRTDHQVKIRGHRIELPEIETVLRQHETIADCVTVAREDTPGDKRLAAYCIPAPGCHVNQAELLTFLSSRLPDYMRPSRMIELDRFPQTPNGKIDRKALPAPDSDRPELDHAFVAPATSAEKTLAEIWQDVLGLDRVGVDDNFFDLGGDSILAVQIVSKANQRKLETTVRQLLEHQTIGELAPRVGVSDKVRFEQGPVTGDVLLTPIQQWFLGRNPPDAHYYNQTMLLEVPAELDAERMEQAVKAAVAHHDALRARFTQHDGAWTQTYLAAENNVLFSDVDFSAVSEDERAEKLRQSIEEMEGSLDLSNGPLLRAAHYNFGAGQPGRLLLAVHHLSMDGISWRILLEDLEAAYRQLEQQRQPSLPAKTASFQTWAKGLAEHSNAAETIAEFDYWMGQGRGGLQPLPVDFPDGENLEGSTEIFVSELDRDETKRLLQDVPAAYATQINDVLLTALAQGVAAWSRSPEVLVDLEGHGREEILEGVDVSRTVGWFTSLFPVRFELPAGLDEGAALKQVKEQLRKMPRRGVGFGLLRYLCEDPNIASAIRTLPAPEIQFNYLGQFQQLFASTPLFDPAEEPPGAFARVGAASQRRPYLLEVIGLVADDQLKLMWHYSKNLHRRESVAALANEYMSRLRGLIVHCCSRQDREFTPSDFPLANLDQQKLNKLAARLQTR